MQIVERGAFQRRFDHHILQQITRGTPARPCGLAAVPPLSSDLKDWPQPISWIGGSFPLR